MDRKRGGGIHFLRNRAAMTKLQASIVVALLIVAIGLAYFLVQRPGKNEILVGASLGLTGPLAGLGQEAKWAYEHIVKETNDQGGLEVGAQRLPVRLIILDDKLDPATAVSNIQRLLTVDKVDLLLGSIGSPIVSAAVQVTEQQHTPWVTVGVSLDAIHKHGYKYLFTPFETNSETFITAFDLLDSLQPKPTKIAIWGENTVLGQEYLALGPGIATERGYVVVLSEQYTQGASDMSDLILKTIRAGAEAVISIPTTPDGGLMLKQSRQLGFFPKIFLLARAASDPSFGRILGNEAEGVMSPGVTWHPDLPFAGNKELAEAYRSETGQEPTFVGSFYAAAQITLEAVRLAKSTDNEAIRNALLENEFSTVIGKVRFNEDGTASKLTILAVQWQHGKLAIVWPKDLANAQIIYPLKQGQQSASITNLILPVLRSTNTKDYSASEEQYQYDQNCASHNRTDFTERCQQLIEAEEYSRT